MNDSEVAAEVAAHVARNRELVGRLAARGIALNEPRPIDLHFWSTSAEDSGAFAAALRTHGLTKVRVDAARPDQPKFSIEGRLLTTVEQVTELQFIEAFVRLAMAYRSEFDGWGTEV